MGFAGVEGKHWVGVECLESNGNRRHSKNDMDNNVGGDNVDSIEIHSSSGDWSAQGHRGVGIRLGTIHFVVLDRKSVV